MASSHSLLATSHIKKQSTGENINVRSMSSVRLQIRVARAPIEKRGKRVSVVSLIDISSPFLSFPAYFGGSEERGNAGFWSIRGPGFRREATGTAHPRDFSRACGALYSYTLSILVKAGFYGYWMLLKAQTLHYKWVLLPVNNTM